MNRLFLCCLFFCKIWWGPGGHCSFTPDPGCGYSGLFYIEWNTSSLEFLAKVNCPFWPIHLLRSFWRSETPDGHLNIQGDGEQAQAALSAGWAAKKQTSSRSSSQQKDKASGQRDNGGSWGLGSGWGRQKPTVLLASWPGSLFVKLIYHQMITCYSTKSHEAIFAVHENWEKTSLIWGYLIYCSRKVK